MLFEGEEFSVGMMLSKVVARSLRIEVYLGSHVGKARITLLIPKLLVKLYTNGLSIKISRPVKQMNFKQQSALIFNGGPAPEACYPAYGLGADAMDADNKDATEYQLPVHCDIERWKSNVTAQFTAVRDAAGQCVGPAHQAVHQAHIRMGNRFSQP